ncbi:MAG: PAS domain-containing protein [Bacteroidetes bacterium]|nr:PAS domain-containing protein [Bacteroidota bacterium]
MNSQRVPVRNKIPGIILLLIIMVAGAFYMRYTYVKFETDQADDVMVVVRSIEATFPKDDLKALEAAPGDTGKPQYRHIKSILREVIRVNGEARFAYVILERNGKVYFIADSEPDSSKDCSPPGQEYTEAKAEDKQPFRDGKAIITHPSADRWGTWVSALIPMKDKTTGSTIAVFGMDYSVKTWHRIILFEVAESGMLVLLLLVAALFIFRIRVKNKSLLYEIEERKRAEDELIDQEHRFRHLVEYSSDILVFLDKDGFQRYISPSAEKITGFKVEELQKSFLQVVHPDDAGRVKLAFEELLMNPDGILKGEYRHQHKNGGFLHFEAVGRNFLGDPNLRGLVVNIRDVTERRKVEESLWESEEKYRTIVSNTFSMISMLDIEGKYIFCNQAYTDILGYSQDELIGLLAFDIVHPDEKESIIKYYQDAILNNTLEIPVTFRLVCKDGSIKIVNHRAKFLINQEQKADKILLIAQDITEQRKAEEKLQQSEALFVDALIKKSRELQHFNDLMIGREIRMVDLKKEVNELLKKAGEDEKYTVHS